jgi:hypothetical protein
MSKVLFVSGSISPGHVTRDLRIAKELRKARPETDIIWLRMGRWDEDGLRHRHFRLSAEPIAEELS